MNGINCPVEQTCISNMYRCDGIPDCGVRSVALDETNCSCQYNYITDSDNNYLSDLDHESCYQILMMHIITVVCF